MKKDTRNYVFVGNREYVLKEIIAMGLNLTAVFVMEDSYLHHRLLNDSFVAYTTVSSKRQLLEFLSNCNYDVLVSNGCKYILPVNDMKRALYVNIHPSFLPDLKGMDPINGACLYKRQPGASCHLIDAGIDTGQIVSRIPIPLTDDIDSIILFQMSFKAEVKAFREAYKRDFIPITPQPVIENALYYTISSSDMNIHFNKGAEYVLNQAKAFGYSTKGLYFKCGGNHYKCFSIREMTNPFLLEMSREFEELEVFMAVDKDILIKLNGRVLRIGQIELNGATIYEKDMVEEIV